jgi:phosphoribosylformylglycinamidine synthase
VGGATAIGEQPIKGLIKPGCGARMSVAEAITNLMFARISDLKVIEGRGCQNFENFQAVVVQTFKF